MKKNNELAVEVKNLSKKYFLSDSRSGYSFLRDEISDFIKGGFRRSKKKRERSFWALKNISFSVKAGEVIGIIGPNGAGKSTLLKILSRITYPTSGKAVLYGRVASLLEIGTGFNPELTGRENIFLNGAILGMRKREIQSMFEEIVGFAEIRKFIDVPVKRYSSGMYVRLAFSIAAHLNPEILLIDEVLAVGDAKFQRKSIGKMDEIASSSGRTIIFVSHDLGAIKRLCKRVILIDKGRLLEIGPAAKVIDNYIDRVNRSVPGSNQKISTKNRTGSGKIRITQVHIADLSGKKVNHAVSGKLIKFIFAYRAIKNCKKANLSFSIHSQLGQNIILHQSKYSKDYFDVRRGLGKIIFTLDSLPLISGTYLINLRVDVGGEEADYPREPVYKLHVVDEDFYGTKVIPLQHSPVLINGKWSHVAKAGDKYDF